MENEKVCCVEAPKRTVGDLVRENTEMIKNIEESLNILDSFLFNKRKEEVDNSEIQCMYEDINFQNYKLKDIIENLKKITNKLN